MDLHQLEYFVRVAACGGFSRASAQLHVAQSALSRHVKQLEHELGVTLLERTPRGAQLTPAGALLRERAGVLMQDVRRLRDEVRAVAEAPGGAVSIGVASPLRDLLGGPLLTHLAEHAPTLQVSFVTALSPEIREGLVSGRFDVGVYGAPDPDQALHARTLLRDDLLLVTPPGSPMASHPFVCAGRLRDLPMAVLSREALCLLFRRLGLPAPPEGPQILEVSDAALQLEMVRTGRYCSVLPRVMVAPLLDRGEVGAAPLPKVAYYWGVAQTPVRPLSLSMRVVLDAVRCCAATTLPRSVHPLSRRAVA